jgi:transaldolase
MNALLELRKRNQSVWLNYIRRDLVRNGELKRLVEQDGVSGIISNSTIFEKAINGGGLYDATLRQFCTRQSVPVTDSPNGCSATNRWTMTESRG